MHEKGSRASEQSKGLSYAYLWNDVVEDEVDFILMGWHKFGM